MIYIYTENFCQWPRFKTAVKILLGRPIRGPQAVENSLMRGLKKLGQDFVLNQKITLPIDTACVLSGAGTLRYLIKMKRRGKIKKILAGPIISVIPSQNDGIITAPEVDAFVVPSQWVKNWWGSLSPGFYDRIKLWPAGVEDIGQLGDKNGYALIFQKKASDSLLQSVKDELAKQGVNYKIIRYGQYGQGEYFKLLTGTKFVVYLNESESQGLALQEAWMRDVPSLVWNRGYLTHDDFRWDDQKIAAPLMVDDCGMFFKDAGEFPAKLNTFLANYQNFHSRQYSLDHFTDEASAKQYLEIISQL